MFQQVSGKAQHIVCVSGDLSVKSHNASDDDNALRKINRNIQKMCEERIDAVNRHQRGEQPSKICKSLGKVRISLPPSPTITPEQCTKPSSESRAPRGTSPRERVTESDIIAEATATYHPATGGRYRIFGETLDIGIGNALDKFARPAMVFASGWTK